MKDGLRPECRDCQKDYQKAHYQANKEKERARSKASREANPDYQKTYQKNRRKTDPEFKISGNLRNRVYQAIKGNSKSASTQELIGCSIEFLKSYLESQFEPWMSWDNYGHKTWHIDHIRPCSSFDFSDPEQQKECFHYTNLQPLAASENLSKGAKV